MNGTPLILSLVAIPLGIAGVVFTRWQQVAASDDTDKGRPALWSRWLMVSGIGFGIGALIFLVSVVGLMAMEPVDPL